MTQHQRHAILINGEGRAIEYGIEGGGIKVFRLRNIIWVVGFIGNFHWKHYSLKVTKWQVSETGLPLLDWIARAARITFTVNTEQNMLNTIKNLSNEGQGRTFKTYITCRGLLSIIDKGVVSTKKNIA